MAPQQLSRSLTPLTGESLPGFLLRTAYRLERSPARVAELVGLASRHRRIAHAHLRAMPEEVIREFALNARLAEREADALTLRRFNQTYPPLRKIRTDSRTIGNSAAVNWAVAGSGRYCPDCLRGDGSAVEEALGGAWQLVWHLPVVFACVQHRRLLEHRCPACCQPLEGAGRKRNSLINNSMLTGLHPLQCRNALTRRRDNPLHCAKPAHSVPCGMRLDRVSQDPDSALPDNDLDHLLALQLRILEYLSPQAQSRDGGVRPDGYYFSDLIATAHLIKLTWPLGAEFLPFARLQGLVQAYVEPLLAQITARQQNQRQKAADNRRTKIAPSDSALCGALLAAADVALGNRELLTLRPRLQPLAREAYRRARSYAGGVCRSTDISPALARATTWRIHRMPVRVELRAGHSTQHHFRVEEIPSFLPLAFVDQYFAELVERLPRFTTAIERHLRRAAPLRLAELKSGAAWDDCAPALGIHPGLARSTLKHLGRQLEALCLWPAFEEAVEQIARYLDTTSQRINYANRRRRLTLWRLPLDDWLTMIDGLPGLERIREQADPTVGSALVWAEVTEGGRMRSPVVLDLLESGEDRRALCALLYRMGNGARGPSLRLRRRLHLYAERLASSCDQNREPAVSVGEVIRDEEAVAAGLIQEERQQVNLDATSRVATLNRAVRELKDPVGQMAPEGLWELFQRVVPTPSDRASKATSQRIGNREALAAIVFASTSGCAWPLLPSGFGMSGQTARQRFIEWTEAHVWTELCQLLRDGAGSHGDLDWSRHAIDAVSTRAGKTQHKRRRIV